MGRALRWVLVWSSLVAGCGDDGRTDRVPPGTDGGTGTPGVDARVPPGTDGGPAPGTDAAIPAGDGGTGADGGSATPIDFCQLSCVTGADCGSGSGAFDADNYRCEAGACRYQGCNDDAECAGSFFDPDYVCRDLGGLPTCQLSCATGADCATGSAAFDEDNYACEAGVCRYTGCNSDSECAATYMDARYGCRALEPPATGVPLPTATRNCVLTCASAADCDAGSAAFDADNYSCEAGACRYTGCNDDAECAGSFLDTDYVCR